MVECDFPPAAYSGGFFHCAKGCLPINSEPKIMSRLANTRKHVQQHLRDADWWEGWVSKANWLAMGLVVALSAGTAAGGKSVTDPVGNVVAPQAASGPTAPGWKTICGAVAVLGGVGLFTGRWQSALTTKVTKHTTVNALLKNLQVDLEDSGRDPDSVTREYQRLIDMFPECAD